MATIQPSAEVLEELGFELVESPAPVVIGPLDGGVALGWSGSYASPVRGHGPADPLEDVHLDPIALPDSLDPELRRALHIARGRNRPGLFALKVAGSVRVAGGAVPQANRDGDRAIDATGREVWVRVDAGGAAALLGFVGTTLRIGSPPDGASKELRAVLDAAAVPRPPAESWMDDGSPGWLRDAVVRRAASPSRLDRACSAGLLRRFWIPTTGTSALDALQLALNPGATPAGVAERWFCELPPSVHRAVEVLAVEEAERLSNLVTEVEASLGRAAETSRDEALVWLHGRDDLEGVRGLLQGVSSGGALGAALEALDQHAATAASMWSSGEPFDDERLRAVGWQYVDAWWGRLAG